ncbi:unnamed protein product [Cunninghamella blakesleeana]
MDKLPIEIIINIFSHLPQKYVLLGTALSKFYYDTLLHPSLFKTLHIYSFQQYEKCITMGKSRRTKINHRCLNYYVEHIEFHLELNNGNHYLNRLTKMFPNIHSIYIPSANRSIYAPNMNYSFQSRIDTIKQFEHFLLWYTSLNGRWVRSVLYKGHNLKTLEFDISSPGVTYSLDYSVIDPGTEIYSSSSSTPIKYNQRILKIHSIAFPVFHALTSLSIYALKCEMDEEFFEFILQLSPQLTSLTLKLFTMNVTEDYGKENLIIHDKPPLKPHDQLKKLDISAIFCDTRCYKYLSFKFPSVESLSLHLLPENNPDESFKLAIYDMVTQYDHLKKLEIHSSSDKVWPSIDLLKWIQQNPTKITHLYYPFHLLSKNKNENDDDNQPQPQPQPQHVDRSIIYNDQHLFLKHDYFSHLSSLSFYLEDQIDMLSYFFLYNDSINMHNPIEELNIKSDKSVSIYLWLNLFPNLRSLNIEGLFPNRMGNVNDKDAADDDDYNMNSINNHKFKELCQLSTQKIMQRQQQINNESSTTTTPITYKLRKIKLDFCRMDFRKYGLNGFFKRCPSLKTIIFHQICCTASQTHNEENIAQQATFDLSHLSLDLIDIKYFHYRPYDNIINHHDVHLVKELMVNETSLDKTYYLGAGNYTQNEPFNYEYSTTLHIICKFIDHIVLNEFKY